MNFEDVERAMGLISTHFPKANWPDAIAQRFGDTLARLPLDYASAERVILDVRLRFKWPRIEPAELLVPLEAAARGSGAPSDAPPSPEEQSLRADAIALARDPNVLRAVAHAWYVALGDERLAHWSPSWLVTPDDVNRWVWGVKFVRWVRANRPDVLDALKAEGNR